MIQFDKSIHPVVLYEYYLIRIFMKIHENFFKKNEGNHVKNYKFGGGVEVRSFLHSWGLLNSCQIVQWDPLNAKQSSAQNIFVWAI